MELQTRNRIAWIDIAKAITILLVVFGHTIRGGLAQSIVYSFHVPTFFFLSGMTCKTDNVKKRIKNDFLRIMVPYYCFGILSILIFIILGQFVADKFELQINTSLPRNLWELLLACPQNGHLKFNLPLWFLPSLFATKLIYYAICKICREKRLPILIVSFGLAAMGFVYTHFSGPGLIFNLSVSLKMLIFFSLGRSFFQFSTLKPLRLGRFKSLALGIVLIAVTVLVARFAPKINYSGDDFPNIPAFLVTSLLGNFGTCFISMGIDNCKIAEFVGKRTLAILAMHKFPILLFQTVGPLKGILTQYNSLICIISAVFVSLISIALCLAAEWIIKRIFPFLLGDFSFLKKKYH